MRPIPDDVRAVIVCPRCHGELADEPAGLRCDTCRVRYRTDNGIPVLLIDEAVPIERRDSSSG